MNSSSWANRGWSRACIQCKNRKEPSTIALCASPLCSLRSAYGPDVHNKTTSKREKQVVIMYTTPLKPIFILEMNPNFSRSAKITPNNKKQRGGFNISLPFRIIPQLLSNGMQVRLTQWSPHNISRSPSPRVIITLSHLQNNDFPTCNEFKHSDS